MTRTALGSELREWPPVYDAETLELTLRRARQALPKQLYLPRIADPEPCQGDVVELETSCPVIDSEGDPSAIGDIKYWIVVANSCDVGRMVDTNDVLFAPVAPLVPMRIALGGDADLEEAARSYKLGRVFFVPAWDDQIEPHVADFTRFVAIHRDALRQKAKIRGRMVQAFWVVLNACLVRFLCRADGRDT